MTKKINLNEYIENNTLRLEASYRGGGIEIDAGEYVGIEGARMTAYQNYLGGGIAGSIQSARNFTTKNKAKADKADKLAEALKKYFYYQNNGGGDDYMQENVTGPDAGGYEATQSMPASAY